MALTDVLSGAITRASAAVDRSVLRFMERQMRGSAPRRPPEDARDRLVELAGFYQDGTMGVPSPFFPVPEPPTVRERPVPRRIDGVRGADVTFPSTYEPYFADYREEHHSYPENLTARARLYGARTPRPTIVCLHGWGGGAYWLEERAFLVSYLLRLGLDVCLFQLPFHGDRAPRGVARGGSMFPSAHVVRTNEGFGQAIHDLRALAGYLLERGAPAVGVCGMSLGGYTTALWASVDDRLAFAVPMIPAVSMADLMWRHGADSPARRRAEKVGVSGALLADVFAVHSPLARAPRTGRDRLLIIAGRGDRITPPDQAEALWEHWGRPAMHWFPGGHLAQVGRGDAFRALRRHLRAIDLAR